MSGQQITSVADAVHFLAIDTDWDDLRLKLICTATKGAPCHKTHPDPEVESFSLDSPDLIDTDTCWAVEWAVEAGWESVQAEDGAAFPMIPVDVTCDEGPVVAPVLPHPTLPVEAEAERPDLGATLGAPTERVHPDREAVARVLFEWDILPEHPLPHPRWDDPHSGRARELWLGAADAVLALFAGRPTVAEVKAEALTYDEDTLTKVYWALGRSGLADAQITAAVNEMQNAGILFRERDEADHA